MKESGPFDKSFDLSLDESNQEPSFNALREQNADLDLKVKQRLATKIESIGGKEVPRSDAYFEHRIHAYVNEIVESLGYDCGHVSISAPAKVQDARASVLALNVTSLAKKTVKMLA